MPKKLDDLSGPFNPNLRFDDFSKDFLIKLMHSWQYAWLAMSGFWYDAVQKRFGMKAADDCQEETWTTIGERINPRYAKLANIQLNTVVDSLKVLQLPLDNSIDEITINQTYDIKNENHVIMTVTRCRQLERFETDAPERIEAICRSMEPKVLAKYLVNPNITVTPLKLPPRKSKDEVACQWELKLKV